MNSLGANDGKCEATKCSLLVADTLLQNKSGTVSLSRSVAGSYIGLFRAFLLTTDESTAGSFNGIETELHECFDSLSKINH